MELKTPRAEDRYKEYPSRKINFDPGKDCLGFENKLFFAEIQGKRGTYFKDDEDHWISWKTYKRSLYMDRYSLDFLLLKDTVFGFNS